jgi:hypothetical protein
MDSKEVVQRWATTPASGGASQSFRVERMAAAAGEPAGTERRDRISGILVDVNGMDSARALRWRRR